MRQEKRIIPIMYKQTPEATQSFLGSRQIFDAVGKSAEQVARSIIAELHK